MRSWRRAVLGASLASGLVLSLATAQAMAADPVLHGLTHDRGHPSATFSAPGAGGLTIFFASAPDRATDGRFFTENVEHVESMTASEIAAGHWLSEHRLEPALYYAMLESPEGRSQVLQLEIRRPPAPYPPGVRGAYAAWQSGLRDLDGRRACRAMTVRARRMLRRRFDPLKAWEDCIELVGIEGRRIFGRFGAARLERPRIHGKRAWAGFRESGGGWYFLRQAGRWRLHHPRRSERCRYPAAPARCGRPAEGDGRPRPRGGGGGL